MYMNDTSASAPKKNSLMIRIISALVMLPIAIFIILQGGILYSIFVMLLTVLILYEWNGICEGKAFNGGFILQAIFSCLVIYSLYSGYYFTSMAYIIPILLLAAYSLYFKMRVHFALLGVIYAILPAVSLIWLRQNSDMDSDMGGWIVLWLMIIVWSMDTGAYFAGKTIGGPKMAPRISPNKTWAGLIGGAITAIVLGTLAAYYFNLALDLDLVILIPLAGALAIWSQIGDLAESALKRHFKVKDSGAIIPGHGGIMDRVDGIVFAAPAMALILCLDRLWS